MPTIRRILVPVDFSAGSRAAFEYAAFLAEPFEAVIDTLHVVEPHPHVLPEMMMIYPPGGSPQKLTDYVRSHAAGELEAFAASVYRPGGARVIQRIEPGEPAPTILKVAVERAHDLIVMGTHGRTGLGHLLMGSVAEKVVRRSSCPVLTIRVPEAPTP